MSGYEIVNTGSATTTGVGTQATAFSTCPAGKKAVGGSFFQPESTMAHSWFSPRSTPARPGGRSSLNKSDRMPSLSMLP